MPARVYDPSAPVLLLDYYDGAPHHENVRLSEHGHFTLYAPAQYLLFQHVELIVDAQARCSRLSGMGKNAGAQDALSHRS